jgi:glutathione S-transferase
MTYRIFGAELSPYSVKIRSYFRFKNLPHAWLPRSGENAKVYEQFARIPIIPLVVTPDDKGMQDSTPIIEAIEADHPMPAIHPSDPVARFVSVLLEEFGDEWGNKWMFHYRWARTADQLSAGGRIARSMSGPDDARHEAAVSQILERMTDRVWFVGSNEQTAPQIEASFRAAIDLLEVHFAEHEYLFGERPAFGDFGLWGQIYNCWTDPTCGSLIEAGHPHLLRWIHRMLNPVVLGDFNDWTALEPTLAPFVSSQVGDLFMPWTLANESAVQAGNEEFTVTLSTGEWVQKPQKYHAKSLAVLRQRYAEAESSTLAAALEAMGCREGLAG